MAKPHLHIGAKFFLGVFILALGFVALLVPATPANAASCPINRVACNSDESRARNACFASRPLVQGAIWFNNSDASATDTGYYAQGVNIGANDSVVGVNIRGSVYTCGQGAGDWSAIYAVGVRPDSVGGAYPDSGRLQITGGNVLYRGNYQGQNDIWSTQGGSVTANLNVSGLATNNINGTATQTITVGIYRCYSSNGSSATGSCSTSLVPVTINRARQPGYSLTPTITINPSSSIESGQTATASPSVSSAGGGNATNVTWQVSRFVLPRGAGIPAASINPSTPQAYYGNGATNEASAVRDFAPGPTALPQTAKVTEDLPVGSKVCYALSVQPYTNNDTLGYWYHSTPACVDVSTKPKVQVLGGDLVVGRGSVSNPAAVSNIVTSTSRSASTGLGFGSWGEYGLIPSGVVFGMASGAMYAGGSGAADLCGLSVLSFSNRVTSSCQPSQIGRYVLSPSTTNVASRFRIPTAAAQIIPASTTTQNLHALTPGRVYTTTRTTLALNNSPVFEAGRWVVLNMPNTTITITGNIDYTTGPIANARAIPQVVIIAKNIIIADSVTNVDAWLIASGGSLVPGSTAADGRINTCGAGGVTETTLPIATQCAAKLTINGPVMANHLILRRTAGGTGAGYAVGAPAEVFNLRPDAYLWASTYSSNTDRLPTVSTKELPPRF
jgi:hypothetical protein